MGFTVRYGKVLAVDWDHPISQSVFRFSGCSKDTAVTRFERVIFVQSAPPFWRYSLFK